MNAPLKLLPLILCALTCPANTLAESLAATLQPRVDERVEVLTIAYSLAIPQQPGPSLNPAYTQAVHQYFGKYSNHPFVTYIRELAQSAAKDGNDLGSWEIPSVALHLGPAPAFEPLVAINDSGVAGDGWDDRTLLTRKFLSLFTEFCSTARCETFLAQQRPYYRLINDEYEKHGTRINQPWFQSFFSLPPTESYSPVIALLGMGGGDYIRVNFANNRRNTHTVFAAASFDKRGIPTDLTNPMIARAGLHEYIHAFTNQLVDSNLEQLRPAAETILANQQVFARMKDTFYGNWKFLLYESLVRACVIQYLLENGEPGPAEKELRAQEKAGFFWMAGLVELLTTYSHERQTYPEISRFMPKITSYFAATAQKMQAGSFPFPSN